MGKVKKALIVALISSPLIFPNLAGAKDYSGHNNEIKSKLSPVSESIKGFVFSDCNKDITLDNYDNIINEKTSGVYKNPFSEDCVPISFESKEPLAFYQEMLEYAEDKDAATDIIRLMISNKYSDNLDTINIHKIYLKDGRVAQLARINNGQEFNKIEQSWKKRKNISAKLEEFVFLHEIFHFHAMNFDRSIPISIREGISDVSAVITISTKYNFTIDQTIEFSKEVMYGRRSEAKSGQEDHFDKDTLSRMLNYFEGLKESGLNLERVDSFESAGNLARKISLDLNTVERKSDKDNRVYWEEGMELSKNTRMTFAEIITLKGKIPQSPPNNEVKAKQKESSDYEMGI